MVIESSYNNIIKHVVSLKLKKERDELKLFIVEGIRFTQDIPKSWDIKMYLISQDFERRYTEKVEALSMRTKVYTVTDNIFKSISDTQNPQGILAVCSQKAFELTDTLANKPQFLLLAHELQDPGNLGTIIRTADAAGVTGIILSKGSVDLYNPKVLRATMGSIFHIPIVQNVDTKKTIAQLKLNGIQIVATHLKSNKTPYSVDLKLDTAIVVGNEANGLTEDIIDKSDILVKLPMIGKAESLNVSMASGILLYEVVRQRL